jgi:hypothetical protein
MLTTWRSLGRIEESEEELERVGKNWRHMRKIVDFMDWSSFGRIEEI